MNRQRMKRKLIDGMYKQGDPQPEWVRWLWIMGMIIVIVLIWLGRTVG